MSSGGCSDGAGGTLAYFDFWELVAELLVTRVPYHVLPVLPSKDGFYTVCDYLPVPQGTVLLYNYPPRMFTIQGYLPQSSPQETTRLETLLAQHYNEEKGLNLDWVGETMLRVLPEEEGVYRLLSLQRLLVVQHASSVRLAFH